MRPLLILAAALALAAPGLVSAQAPPPAVAVPPLAYTARTLPNGLNVYALRDPASASVTVQIWYDVGAKDDPQGRSGFAHLFEHILSRKTRNMPLNMVNQLTEDIGGVRNASTGQDVTNYYETVPAAYLETMLWTHAERMARPVVDAQVFETERSVVKEELRQRVLAPPYGRLQRFVIADNAFDDHAYRRPGIGSIADLDAATIEDARAFHEAYYGPDSATLIVSGNFEPARLNALVDQYFAPIPRRARPGPRRPVAVDPPRTSPRAVIAYAPNVPLPAVVSLWQGPKSTDPDSPAMIVADAILSQGVSSRLYKSLVYDKALASQATTSFSLGEDGGYFATYTVVASGKDPAVAAEAARAEIARLREAPVTAAELAEAKVELAAAELRARETADQRAFALGYGLVDSSGDPTFADRQAAAIQRVTAADIQRVARRWWADNARVDITYLDESKRPAGEPDRWANPAAQPRFLTVPPAQRAAIVPAPEAERQAPPAPTARIDPVPPVIAERILPNGLRVVAARSGATPLVTMALVVRGGAAFDPPGKAGLAGLAALLTTKGAGDRNASQIAAELEALGAVTGSGAGPDGSLLQLSAPVAVLGRAGPLFADMAIRPTFPAAEVARFRTKALDDLTVAMKDPGALANLVTQRVMFGGAAYGAPVDGTAASIASLTDADFTNHHRNWWRPDNAVLIIAGGIDSAAAFAEAERLFGGWRATGPMPPVQSERDGPPAPPRVVVVDMPGAGQAAVVAAVRAPSRTEAGFYPMTVANAVLGAGSRGRLFEEIRVKRALSYGAYSNFPGRLDGSMVSASAQTKNESAADVAAVFLAEFDRLSKDLPAEALANRKTFLAGGFGRQVETTGGLATFLSNLAMQGVPTSEAGRYLQALGSVTLQDAARVSGQVVSADKASLIIVGDAKLFLPALRAKHPTVEVIPATELDLASATLRTRSAGL